MVQREFFLYTRSNDLAASRSFYRDLVGFEQIWDEPDSVAFALSDAVQFAIGFDRDAVPSSEWSLQPGWVHGLKVDPQPPYDHASWRIALGSDAFRSAVDRLQHATVQMLRPQPFWVGYWSFVVRDPMGQTVELSNPESESAAADL